MYYYSKSPAVSKFGLSLVPLNPSTFNRVYIVGKGGILVRSRYRDGAAIVMHYCIMSPHNRGSLPAFSQFLPPVAWVYRLFEILCFHPWINSVFTSQWAFCFFFKCYEFLHGIEQNRVHCKGELSLAFSHCLCGCQCKGINLWPHQILAWMIVVRFFEQHGSWSVQPSYKIISYEKFKKLNWWGGVY